MTIHAYPYQKWQEATKSNYMKVSAIICELNPAHNGHKYIFDEARRRSGADYMIALMSGNYVQRGEPALLDKYQRARMALEIGADLVLELPSPFSFQSAREFAMAGVSLAEATGIVDVLCFGAEFPKEHEPFCKASGRTSGRSSPYMEMPSAPKAEAKGLLKAYLPLDDKLGADTVLPGFEAELNKAASILLNEPEDYKKALKAALREGLSYPKASELALRACGIADAGLISSPNNILAREYLRALLTADRDIKPLIIQRLGDGYNDDVPKDTRFASATALRRLLLSGASVNEIKAYIPSKLYGIYEDILAGKTPLIQPDDISDILELRLLSLIYEGAETKHFDIPGELLNRIMKEAERPLSFTERAMDIKAKGYTYTRISRALLNLCLGVKDSEISSLKEAGYVPYIRILGFRRQASGLLSCLKEQASVPVISNAAAGRDLLGSSVFYDNIYYSLMASAQRRSFQGQNTALLAAGSKTATSKIRNEYERQIIII